MRALAILGPAAGERALAPFRLPGVELAVGTTTESGAPPCPADAERGSFDAALVFGGDGTVHHQLAALRTSQMPLLVVPTGSGNDFAQALGLATPTAALAAWKRFVAGELAARNIDLGQITPLEQPTAPTLFCCVAGAGLDATANRRANAMPAGLRARGGYLLAAVSAILTRRLFRAQLTATAITGEPVLELNDPAVLVAIANAPAYGGGLRIAPGAKLDDGRLDVIYVHRAGRLRLLRVAPTVLTGEHVGLKEVAFVRAAAVTLTTDPPRDLYADGEFAARTPLRIDVLPKALRVIC
jgi:diacylglycerol kinase (ATP)